MIGELRSRIGAMALAMAAGIGAMPDLGQQRTLSSRPGTGIVRRSGPAPKRRDGARQAAAQAKRERKNAKRRDDWHRCWIGSGATWRGRYWPTEGVSRGK